MIQPFYPRILLTGLVLSCLLPATVAQRLPRTRPGSSLTANRITFQPSAALRTSAVAFSAATASTNAANVLPANAYQLKFDYNYGVLNSPAQISFSDLDGDGKPDIATNSNGQSVYTFKNNSTPGNINASSFGAPVLFTAGASNALTTADMDGDGKNDLVAVGPTLDSILIFINTGSGSLSTATFSQRISIAVPGPLPNDAHLVSVSDLDGDGHRDIIVSYVSGSREYLAFMRNNSPGALNNTSFSLHLRLDYQLLLAGLTVGDLDGDGKPDIVLGASGQVIVLRNASTTGNIAFALGINALTANLSSIALADIDGDGKKEILINTVTAPGDGILHILKNNASPGLIAPASFGPDATFTSGSGKITAGDLDNDGKQDVAVGDTNKISVWLNTATPGNISASSLAAKVDIPVSGRMIGQVAIGDLDGDGMGEIAAGYSIPGPNTVGGLVIFQMSVPATAPAVDGLVPATGAAGATVIISGANFNTAAASNGVYFGAVKATVVSASATQLQVQVPAGASFGFVSILNTANGLTGYSRTAFTPTFANPSPSGIPANFYQPKFDIGTGTLPYAVAFGDLDNDGKPDMIVCNTGSNTISVYRNASGSGAVTASSFSSRFDFPTGQGPVAVAVGDLDGDGKPDLVTANEQSGTISIFRNLSSGAFGASSLAPSISLATGSHPYSLALSDLNGNGKPEIIVCNLNSNSISFFDNQTATGALTTASFAPRNDLGTGSTAPRSIAAGDLNGDGKPEIVFVHQGSDNVSIWHNLTPANTTGPATFFPWSVLPTGSSPIGVVIGDIDRDGRPDLAVANNGSSTVSVFRNTISAASPNTASFNAKVDFTTGTGPFSIAIGDLDGDGLADLATAGSLANSVSVLRNNAPSGMLDAGAFAPAVGFASSNYPLGIAINDLDGDGAPEVAVSTGANTVSLFRFSLTQPSLQPLVNSFSPAQGPAGTTVTITGDRFNANAGGNIVYFGAAKATVTAASATSLTVTSPVAATYQPITVLNTADKLQGTASKAFSVTFPNPAGTTGIPDSYVRNRKDIFTNSGPYAVAYSDLDGDGKSDLVVLNAYTSKISILQNTTPAGTITGPTFAPLYELSTGSDPRGIAVGDVNGDGKPDIAVANNSSSTVTVFQNFASPGTLSSFNFSGYSYTTGTHPFSVSIGDVDGDGRPEIVTASYDPAGVTVLTNRVVNSSLDDNSFALKTDLPAGLQPRYVAMGDLDGDRKADLVVADQAAGLVSVYRNTSTVGTVNASSFAPRVDFATGANPQGIVIADIDGDNKGDVCVANFGSASVSVLRNTAVAGSITASSFASRVDVATGDAPFSIAASEADGDGKVDLLTCNANPSRISILRNLTTGSGISLSSFERTDFNTGGYPVFIAAGDLDADGVPEIVTANVASNNISILNTHAAETAVPVITALSLYHAPVGSAVTISGSGFSATPSSNIVYFGSVKASVTGGNANSLTVTVPTGASYKPVTVLNSQAGLGGVAPLDFGTTFLNPAVPGITAGFYRPKVDFPSLGLPYYVQLADMDGDGKPDMVIAGGSATISVRRNISQTGTIDTGSFGEAVSYNGQGGFTLSVNDMDGDGKLDIISMNPIGSVIGLYRNTSTPGSIAFGQTIELQTGNTIPVYTMVTGDLDGDGKPEIAYASTISGGITVIKNTSVPGALAASSFSTRVSFPLPTGTAPRYLAIGDLDGDRKPEIVAVNQNTNDVSVYRNTTVQGSLTNTSFAARVSFSTGGQPSGLAISDMDGDNKPDVVVLNTGSSTISVFRNTAVPGSITASSLAPAANFATSPQPYALTVTDADGDGRPDLLTANAASATMSVFRNTGSAGSIDASSFAGRVDFPTGGYTVGITTADADNDGIPEVVTTSTLGNNNNNTSVFKVNASTGFQAVSGGSSGLAATATEKGLAGVQLFPNPTRGEFSLAVPAGQGVYSVEIVNLDGKLISRRSYNAGASGAGFVQQLSLLSQPAGTYYVKIIGTAGIRIQKLVLQR